MGKTKRFWIVVVASILAVLMVLVLSQILHKDDTIRIGCVISMSGSASHLVDVRDGMEMAVSEVNRWGGIKGREVALVVQDSC